MTLQVKLIGDEVDDYYYGDDDGFDNYEAKTTDPGPWFLIGVCIYSFVCIMMLPILIVFGKRRERRRQLHQQWTESGSSADFDGSVISEQSEMSGVKEGFEVELDSNQLAVIDISAESTNQHNRSKRRKAPPPLDLDHEVRIDKKHCQLSISISIWISIWIHITVCSMAYYSPSIFNIRMVF